MKRTAELKDSLVEMRFDYSPELIGLIKNEVPGRKWNPDNRCWTAPLSEQIMPFLQKNQFIISQNIADKQNQKEEKTKEKIAQIPELPDSLFPFQKEGVKHIQKTNGHALIASEMGLGKTVQALAWLQYCAPSASTIIIVPAAVKLHWQRMAEVWAPRLKTIVLYGGQTQAEIKALSSYNAIIVNYDLLIRPVKDSKRKLSETLTEMHKPDVIIIDETHMICNAKAQRTKTVRIMTKGKQVIALSGTPITSRPIQFFTILNLLCPEDFPSYWSFAQRYCGARHNGYGWDFSGATNVPELHEKLTDTCMIRHLKKDVLADLPDKLRDVVPLEIDNRQEYQDAERDFIGWLQGKGETEKAERAKHAEALSEMEGLKQLAVKGKLNSVIQWVDEFLGESPDKKLILFTHHIKIRDSLYHEYKNLAVMAMGGNSTQEAADVFQNNSNIRLFIGNMDAAGIGITLTAASTVAFVELAWTPGKMQQAEDRAHRIGQKNCVNIYYLIAEKTIEEDIAKILDKKTKVLNQVLDGKNIEGDSLIIELLRKYKNE